MFDRMLETTGPGRSRSFSPLAVSVALTGHLAATLVVLGASYLILEQVRDPDPSATVFLRDLSIVFDRTENFLPRREGGPPRSGGRAAVPVPLRPSRPRIDDAPPVPPEAPPIDPTREILDSIPRDFGSELPGSGPPGEGGRGGEGGNGDRPGGPGDREGAGSSGPPLLVSGDIEPPVLLHKVEPVYPEIARRARMQGRVVLRAVVGFEGDVESVEVLSATSPFLEDAAVVAVKQWRYRPARYHGLPVAVYFTVTVSFVLH